MPEVEQNRCPPSAPTRPRANVRSSHASAELVASGFSQSTCLPIARALCQVEVCDGGCRDDYRLHARVGENLLDVVGRFHGREQGCAPAPGGTDRGRRRTPLPRPGGSRIADVVRAPMGRTRSPRTRNLSRRPRGHAHGRVGDALYPRHRPIALARATPRGKRQSPSGVFGPKAAVPGQRQHDTGSRKRGSSRRRTAIPGASRGAPTGSTPTRRRRARAAIHPISGRFFHRQQVGACSSSLEVALEPLPGRHGGGNARNRAPQRVNTRSIVDLAPVVSDPVSSAACCQ